MLRWHQFMILAMLASLVTACVQVRPKQKMSHVYIAEEYLPYTKSGTGTIEGQAYVRPNGDNIVTCAGNEVLLMPATPFTRELLDILAHGAEPEKRNRIYNPRLWNAMKTTKCDASGHFKFYNLPSANWFVATVVAWSDGYARQGGTLIREINSQDHKNVELVLWNANYDGRYLLHP